MLKQGPHQGPQQRTMEEGCQQLAQVDVSEATYSSLGATLAEVIHHPRQQLNRCCLPHPRASPARPVQGHQFCQGGSGNRVTHTP